MPSLRAPSNFATADAPQPALLDACVRCGACVQACPTYQEIGVEPDDPRGRVFLIKAAADGQLSLNASFEHHINNCLDCRACETACPMGVQVGRLIEEARGELRYARPPRGIRARLAGAVMQLTFPSPRRFELLSKLLWLGRRSGALRLLRRIAPARLRTVERHTPTPPWRSARQRLRRRVLEPDASRGRVALLQGCIMNTVFAGVTVDTADVLVANGWQVTLPASQTCCGALHVHEGDRDTGKALARRNIAAFEASGADAYVVNAAGCGSALKEYGTLLRNDPDWAARARAFSRKVRDVHAFLDDHGWTPPAGRIPMRAVYQDACHLAHAQGIRRQPRALLQSIPGVELEEMRDSDRCCGSAGIYNLTHPELSASLLERKIADVPANIDTLVTANPGCHLHLLRGLREAGRPVRVAHVMEVMAASYRAATERSLAEDGA